MEIGISCRMSRAAGRKLAAREPQHAIYAIVDMQPEMDSIVGMHVIEGVGNSIVSFWKIRGIGKSSKVD